MSAVRGGIDMARKRRRRKRRRYRSRSFLGAVLLFVIAAIYAGYYQEGSGPGAGAFPGMETEKEHGEDTGNSQKTQGEEIPKKDGEETASGERAENEPLPAGDGSIPGKSEFRITYLDVGQADCTILQCDGQAMLIDAGNNNDAETVLEALYGLGIEKLDYVVATHSHEDHIGAMDTVLQQLPAEHIIYYRENVKEGSMTETYRSFLQAAEENGAEYIAPEPLKEFSFGSAGVMILGPSEEVCTDPNNSSVCLMVTYGKNKFLFTGDAEAKSEQAMLRLGISLEADVFQAGHHGSSTSNSEEFLEAADPVYAVISCGAGNEYGHPHSEVLARLEELDVMIYRTDTLGTITLVSDGSNISISTKTSGK